MRLSRRAFLTGSVGIASGLNWGSLPQKTKLPIAFSTLGCPAWSLETILSFAQQHGFAAIEMRGLEGNLDLPSHPAFAAGEIAETKRQIALYGIALACVSSSARLGEPDPDKRTRELADARKFIDLAASLGAPYVRVFGDGEETGAEPGPAERARVARGLRELGDYGGPEGVTVILESHDNYTKSGTLREVLTAAESTHVGLLWDAHHTFVTAGEDPEVTVKQLGRWIRHTHLKDSAGTGKDRKYVLTGHGNIPIRRQIEALQAITYPGLYCFEWEKVWHPELEDPAVAIADYARVVSSYFR